MAFPVTQVKTRDAYGVTYAAPTSPSFTVRFKSNASKKSLSGHNVQNFLTEIIVNDSNSITVGSDTVEDPISVRLRVSSTLESSPRVSEILTELAAKLSQWEDENVFLGFSPVTAPGQVL